MKCEDGYPCCKSVGWQWDNRPGRAISSMRQQLVNNRAVGPERSRSSSRIVRHSPEP